MNDFKDFADLCQLNILEERAGDDPANKDSMDVIAWKKRRVVEKIMASQPPVSVEVIKQHKKNQID